MKALDALRNRGHASLTGPFAGLTAILLLLGVCQAASAATVQVTPADAVYPQHALVVSGSGLGALSAQRVHIVENGQPVRSLSVRSLQQPSAHDFGVVLVIDVSPTVGAIEHAVAAGRALAAQRPAQEQFGIVEADAFPPVALRLTRNAASIDSELASTPALSHHGLHVYDAAMTGMRMLRNAHIAAGSVIVLSDGADHGEPATLKRVAAIAAAGHIRIFAVGVDSPRFNRETLVALAQVGGGQYVKTGRAQLSQVFGAIQTRLSRQYLIRYFSAQAAGKRIPASIHIDGAAGGFDISYSPPAVPPAASSPPRANVWTSTSGALLVTLVCAFLLGAAVLLLTRRQEGVEARVRSFITASVPRVAKHRTLVQRALGDPSLRRKGSMRWIDSLVLEFDVARIQLSPGRLALLTVAGTFLLGWALASATGSPVAAVLALALPVAVRIGIRFRARRQRKTFEEQLPDNLQVIASALRAGHTFIGSLGVMVEDAPEPSRRELSRALADEALGVPLVDALDRVSTRMDSTDFKQVTLVATLQRDTGGNTAEVIDLVSNTVSDRLDLRRLVRSLTAQGRLASLILCGLPVALMMAISIINPSYTKPLFNTTPGLLGLGVAVVMLISGSAVLQKIVNIEI